MQINSKDIFRADMSKEAKTLPRSHESYQTKLTEPQDRQTLNSLLNESMIDYNIQYKLPAGINHTQNHAMTYTVFIE